jgi:hypothetical protein
MDLISALSSARITRVFDLQVLRYDISDGCLEPCNIIIFFRPYAILIDFPATVLKYFRGTVQEMVLPLVESCWLEIIFPAEVRH